MPDSRHKSQLMRLWFLNERHWEHNTCDERHGPRRHESCAERNSYMGKHYELLDTKGVTTSESPRAAGPFPGPGGAPRQEGEES